MVGRWTDVIVLKVFSDLFSPELVFEVLMIFVSINTLFFEKAKNVNKCSEYLRDDKLAKIKYHKFHTVCSPFRSLSSLFHF